MHPDAGDDEEDPTAEDVKSFDEVYFKDVEAMVGLYDKEELKWVRHLAELSNHEQPVNCVRWNTVGTFFASGGDDGRAILWEFKGYKYVGKTQDLFAKAASGGIGPINQADFAAFASGEQQEEKLEIREDWQAKKIWRNH